MRSIRVWERHSIKLSSGHFHALGHLKPAGSGLKQHMLAIQSQLVMKFSRAYERSLHVVLGWTRLEEVLDCDDYEAQPYFPCYLTHAWDDWLVSLFAPLMTQIIQQKRLSFLQHLPWISSEIYCVKLDKHVMFSVTLAHFNKVTCEASFHWSALELSWQLLLSIMSRLWTWPLLNE